MNTMSVEQPVFKKLMWVVAGAGVLLLVPLTAMQFTAEVDWTALDFVAAAVLLIGTGATYVLVARTINTMRARVIFGFALALAFFVVWAELAVGIIGTSVAGC
ncbi:MAG: hypothetical protein V4484_16535 [Pseudomonadota bacterium]